MVITWPKQFSQLISFTTLDGQREKVGGGLKSYCCYGLKSIELSFFVLFGIRVNKSGQSRETPLENQFQREQETQNHLKSINLPTF